MRRAEEELAQLVRSRKAFIAQMRALLEKQATELAAADDAGASAVASVTSRSEVPAYAPLAAVPPRASLNPTQAFPMPAVPTPTAAGDDDAPRDAVVHDDAPPSADRGSVRLTIDTVAPRTPPSSEAAGMPPSRPPMPTPSWLDAVDEEERS